MRYLPFIEKEFPHLAGRYRATYANDFKVSEAYTESLRSRMKALCEAHGVAYGYYGRAPYRAVEAKFAGDDQLELLGDSADG
jgi:hypothetical protein